jgi:hypothetical protein
MSEFPQVIHEFVYRGSKYRIVKDAKEVSSLLEGKCGKDAMGVDRWNSINPGDINNRHDREAVWAELFKLAAERKSNE